ncbi:MAG: hypothetical protein DRH06_09615 [Deltaproteobacteria bacterium]|nr:MAG: hypothetical protein DRH06_09615 [Deltaproteobacteria bacterium]
MEQTVSALEDNPKLPKLMIYVREILLAGGNTTTASRVNKRFVIEVWPFSPSCRENENLALLV